jgi:LemA protein
MIWKWIWYTGNEPYQTFTIEDSAKQTPQVKF